MGQEFRQGCTNWLPYMVSTGSPGSRQLATCLVWQVQPVSVTHLHHVGVPEGRAQPGASSTPRNALLSLWSAQQSQTSFVVTRGSVWERTWKPPISEDWTQIGHLITSAMFSLPIPAQTPKEKQYQRICGLFCTCYSESKKNVPCWSLHLEVNSQARNTKTKLEDSHLESWKHRWIAVLVLNIPPLNFLIHENTNQQKLLFKLLLTQNQTGLINLPFHDISEHNHTIVQPSQQGFLGGAKKMGRFWLKPCWFL